MEKDFISNLISIAVISIDHAIFQHVDPVLQSFENDYFTLGIFIDLSKVFDTADHSILLKNLKCIVYIKKIILGLKVTYQIESNKLRAWEISTDMQVITCDVPKGSILAPFLFCFMLATYQNHLRL